MCELYLGHDKTAADKQALLMWTCAVLLPSLVTGPWLSGCVPSDPLLACNGTEALIGQCSSSSSQYSWQQHIEKGSGGPHAACWALCCH
jgi:hypothetical protein